MSNPVPPVIPDPNNPGAVNQPVISLDGVPPITQTPAPVDPVIAYLQRVEQQFGQQFDQMRGQLQAQQDYIGQLGNRINQPPAPQPVQLPDPNQDLSGYLDGRFNMLSSDLQRTIQPMNQSMQQFQNTQQYQAIKNQCAVSQPNIRQYWHQIEPVLDQAFSSGQIQPSFQSVMLAISSIYGNLSMQGRLVSSQNQNQNGLIPIGQNQQQQFLPPNVPPSSIPQNQQIPQNFQRPLDENEKRIARERGWTTQEQLLEYRKSQENTGPMQLKAAGVK